MQAIIQLLLLAYTMEGLKAADVVVMSSVEAGANVFRCMSPVQHQASRANDLKRRMRQQLTSYVADVEMQPSKIYCEGKTETMYVVIARIKM